MTRHEPAQAARPKVLYVIGTQRGGTTIAGRLIGQLAGFAFLGELRKLWQVGLPQGRRCGCGQSYATCPVWSVVLARVGGDADAATLQRWQEAAAPDHRSSVQAWRLTRQQRRRAAAASYSELLAATYRALASVTGARVLIDTSKLPADAVLVSRLADVDAYFVELVRDPHGTVHSAIQRSAKPAGSHPRLAVTGSTGWLARHLSAGMLLRSLPAERRRVVTYERLVTEPAAVLGELAEFAGEPQDATRLVVHGRAALDVAHTPIGGGRFGPTSVVLSQDDRWVSAMSGADRRITSALTWPLARRFGYAGSGVAPREAVVAR